MWEKKTEHNIHKKCKEIVFIRQLNQNKRKQIVLKTKTQSEYFFVLGVKGLKHVFYSFYNSYFLDSKYLRIICFLNFIINTKLIKY